MRKVNPLVALAIIVALSPIQCLALCCLTGDSTVRTSAATKQAVAAEGACCPMTSKGAASACRVKLEQKDRVSVRSCCLTSKPGTTVPAASGREGVPTDLAVPRPVHELSAKPSTQPKSDVANPFLALRTHLQNCVIRI